MSLILSGTDGLSDVDGTAATPAIRGTDANTGIFFGTDIIGFSEGGVESIRIDAAGNVGQNGAASAWAGAGRYVYQINDTVVGYFSAKTRGEFTCNYYYNGSVDSYIQNGYSGLYLIDSTTGNHTWFTAPNNSSGAGATMTTTASMTLNNTGALALRGASTSANGVGITFPATQSASTDANTLDDYEEGTWTPVLRGSGTAGNFNQATSTGKYTKIGNMVTLYCAITGGSVTGSPTGDLQITGLPFACAAGTSAAGAAQTQYLGITQVPVVSFSTRGTSSILYLAYVNGSQVAALVQASAVGSTAIVDFCISYPT